MKDNASVTMKLDGVRLTAQIDGEIDHHSAKLIRREIDDGFADSGASALTLDMSRVRFMDSSGLGLILGRYAKVQALGGTFCVADPSASVRRVLDVAGAGRIVDIYDSRTGQKSAAKRESGAAK